MDLVGHAGEDPAEDVCQAPMRDQFDVSLVDEELLSEVELTTSLIIAACECAHDHLPQEQIDAILGIPQAPTSRASGQEATSRAKIPRPRAPEHREPPELPAPDPPLADPAH
jgi:hypothetical protein